ncbi:MAG: T9SS type A sorting domain-containing protein [Bacteroidetes bacterium]|nr:T9SS type A sorting domain-containing protein [Bacteroidota bacterium]
MAFAIGGTGYMGTGGTSSGATSQFWAFEGGPIGIGEVANAQQIHPTLSENRILLSGWRAGLADTYAILDATGKTVATAPLQATEIPLAGSLAKGLYLLHLIKGSETQLVWRFVITD